MSNMGRIKSLDMYMYPKGYPQLRKGRILKPARTGKSRNYLTVRLGHEKAYKVHRLVAEAFIPNPNGFPEVNHIDENKENNCVENLEWCTGEYNLCYGTRLKRISESKKMKVAQYSLNGELLKVFNSQGEAAEKTNSTQGGISDCIRGRIKTHNGYVWKKYVENNE